MLGGDRRLYPTPRRGNRLDGGYDRSDDGLEDRVFPGEVVLSLSASGYGRTQRPLLFIFIRRERLLPWWPSGLGAIPSCLPSYEAAIHTRGQCFGIWVLLGLSSQDTSAGK